MEVEEIVLPARIDLAEQFKLELEALGGECLPCTPEQLPKTILDLLKSYGINRLLVDACGVELLTHRDLELVQTPDDTCRAGLTWADAGLADTGSLLVTGGAGKMLSASLLPEIHLAILNLGDLHASLEDVIPMPLVRDAPSAVVISGPSRTADIEMTLTIGVHGPGKLIVLLVDDSGSGMIK